MKLKDYLQSLEADLELSSKSSQKVLQSYQEYVKIASSGVKKHCNKVIRRSK